MAGTYINVYITSPLSGDKFSPSSKVSATAKVYNKSNAMYISVTGVYDSEAAIPFSPDYVWAEPNAVQAFSGSFAMPSKNTRITVYAYYWDGAKWVFDDSVYIDIVVEVVPEPSFKNFKILDYSKR